MDPILAISTSIIAGLIVALIIMLVKKVKPSKNQIIKRQLRTYSKGIIRYIDNEKNMRNKWGSFLPINLKIDFISSYVSLSAKKFYEDIEGMTYKIIDDIEELLINFLKNKASCIIIGDFGCGKSTLMAFLVYKLSKYFLKKRIHFCTIAIPMRYLHGEDIVNEIFQFLKVRFNVDFIDRALFINYVRSGKIALILDGLDEYVRIKEGRHYSYIFKLINELISDNSRLIITSRLSIFQTSQELTEYFNKSVIDSKLIAKRITSFSPYEIFEIMPLSDNQISGLINKKSKNYETNNALIFENNKLKELARHHILLDMIIDTMPLLLKGSKNKNLSHFSIFNIYDLYISNIINRDLFVIKKDKTIIEKIYEEIAYRMFKNGDDEIDGKEIQEIINITMENITGSIERDNNILINISSSLIIKTSEEKYRFIHRTFLEYFVAKNLVNSLRKNEFDKFADKNIVYHESILHFTRESLGDKDIPLLEKLLHNKNEWVRFSSAHYLARLKSKDSIKHIMHKLKYEKSFTTRREFYIALAFLGMVDFFHNFINELDKNRKKDQLNNDMVIDYFGSMQLALDGCAKRLMELNQYPTREMIIRFLGENGFREHIPILRKYLNDDISSVKDSALHGINKIKSKYSEPKLVKGLIFDLDGVIVDSMNDHIYSWKEAISVHIGSDFDSRIIRYTEGMKSQNILKEILKSTGNENIDVEYDLIIKTKKEIMESRENFSPMKGIDKLLKFLHNNGIRTAIVTGSSRKRADKIRSLLGYDLIHYIISSSDTQQGKPSPEPYLAALEKLKLTPTEVLVIENAPLGIDSAQYAKIFCVAIKSTLGFEDLKSADKVVGSLDEVLNMLQS